MEDRMTAQQLKNSILQMAVQGKLVPQDSNDEPASVLLERIRKEKEQLIKDGKIKKNKKESYIFRGADNLHYEQIGKEVKCIEDELPFEIPNSWECIRLNNLGIYKKGPFGSALTKSMFVPRSDESIKVYEQKNAIQKNWKLGKYYITKKYYLEKMQSFTVNPGDIIVSCAGTIGETYIMPSDIEIGIINQALMKMTISKNINIDYFLLVFNNIIKTVSTNNSKGSAIKNIPPFSILKQIIVPIPPKEEQKRIVDKVNELEPLVEKYKFTEEKLYELNSNIKEQLKKSILQYAIEGKLVPQDSNDEPASILLDRIRKEKQKLIAEGKIKKDKNEPIIYRRDNSYYEKFDKSERCINDQIPFEIPSNWCWEKLSSFCIINMGSSPKGNTINSDEKGGYEFHQGKSFFSSKYLLKSNVYTNQPTKLCSSYSVLLCVRAPVGKVNIVDRTICIGRGLTSIKPFVDFDIELLYYFLTTRERYFIDHSTGSTFKAITSNIVKECLLPVPPKNEQNKLLVAIKKTFSLLN